MNIFFTWLSNGSKGRKHEKSYCAYGGACSFVRFGLCELRFAKESLLQSRLPRERGMSCGRQTLSMPGKQKLRFAGMSRRQRGLLRSVGVPCRKECKLRSVGVPGKQRRSLLVVPMPFGRRVPPSGLSFRLSKRRAIEAYNIGKFSPMEFALNKTEMPLFASSVFFML